MLTTKELNTLQLTIKIIFMKSPMYSILFIIITIIISSCKFEEKSKNDLDSIRLENVDSKTETDKKVSTKISKQEYKLSIHNLKEQLKLTPPQIKKLKSIKRKYNLKLTRFKKSGKSKKEIIDFKKTLITQKSKEIEKTLKPNQNKKLSTILNKTDLSKIKKIYPF